MFFYRQGSNWTYKYIMVPVYEPGISANNESFQNCTNVETCLDVDIHWSLDGMRVPNHCCYIIVTRIICNSAFEQGHLEPWRYINAFIIIIIIIIIIYLHEIHVIIEQEVKLGAYTTEQVSQRLRTRLQTRRQTDVSHDYYGLTAEQFNCDFTDTSQEHRFSASFRCIHENGLVFNACSVVKQGSEYDRQTIIQCMQGYCKKNIYVNATVTMAM